DSGAGHYYDSGIGFPLRAAVWEACAEVYRKEDDNDGYWCIFYHNDDFIFSSRYSRPCDEKQDVLAHFLPRGHINRGDTGAKQGILCQDYPVREICRILRNL